MAKVSKRIKALREGFDRNKLYEINEALGLVKKPLPLNSMNPSMFL